MEQRERWYTVGEPGIAGLPAVRVSYRLGLGPHLYRARGRQPVRGGLLGLELGKWDGRGNGDPFCGEVLRECGLRQFSGVVCLMEEGPRPLGGLLARLADRCRSRGLGCWVTEAWGEAAPAASVLIPTAVSGGSLEGRLREAVGRFGARRTSLWLERAGEDFTLPAPEGRGKKLTPEELEALLQKQRAGCFFSDALCARYFTYMEGERGHFVLFDDLSSLEKKLTLGRQLGLETVFLPLEELGELADQLAAGR